MWNQDLSVLISMPFDGASSEGERYGAGQRQLSPGRFKKGSENPERIEKYWNQQQSRIFFYKGIDSRDLEKTGRIALV